MSIDVALLFPTVASSYPFHLTWTDINPDEDGTIVYREISGVFHEVGFVGPNVTGFIDDPPGAAGDTFCWTVWAFREDDISGSSDETCASVPTTSVNPRRQTQNSAKAKQNSSQPQSDALLRIRSVRVERVTTLAAAGQFNPG
jgi:hypothetical protein